MITFPATPEGRAAYTACLQRGEGFIANCCSGYRHGFMIHRANCWSLDLHKTHNPIRGATRKIWAATLTELDAYQARNRLPGTHGLNRCPYCLQTEAPKEYDTDMPRESHLVVPGGQVESNRKRH